jgi:hypothetical protein
MNIIKVGVALTEYREANWCPAPTCMSTLTKAIRPDPTPLVFCSAISSKVGSMKRQGPQVAEVKNATTARCEVNIDWNDAKFVETCIGEAMEVSPEVGGPGFRTGDAVVVDRDNDVDTPEVLWLVDGNDSAVGPEYIRSIVGRNARPKSVERKSDGRSAINATKWVR